MSGIRSIHRNATLKGVGTATSAPIYVDSDDNRLKMVPTGSGTTEVVLQEAGGAGQSEVLTTTRILTLADSGKTFYLALATGFTVTLPAISGSGGFRARFFVQIAPTTAYIISTAENDNIAGQIYSSTGGDADSETAFTADILNFVANVSLIGDSADVFSDGVGWYARGFCDADAGMTLTG